MNLIVANYDFCESFAVLKTNVYCSRNREKKTYELTSNTILLYYVNKFFFKLSISRAIVFKLPFPVEISVNFTNKIHRK